MTIMGAMIGIIQEIGVILPQITIVSVAVIMLMFGVFVSKEYAIFWTLFLSFAGLIISCSMSYHLLGYEGSTTILYGALRMDHFAAISVFTILCISLWSFIILYFMAKSGMVKQFEAIFLPFISIAGMTFMVCANSLLSLYMSMEVVSLSSYIMTSYDRNNALSTEAGMKYFILGSLASCLYLFGTSLIYGFAGTIQFDELAIISHTEISDSFVGRSCFGIGVIPI